MLDVIRSIADQGLTMIIVTHEMSFARDVSDHVAYFEEGHILEQGTPEPTTPPACGRGCMTSVRPATLSEFADLNLKMVGFVNNHTGDYGPQGVLDTMNAAEAHDLIACGVGRSLRESMDEGCLNIERGEKAHVRTFVNQKDADEVLKSVADASKRSDLTIFSLHTHEGVNENWYSSQPPDVYECREFILWDEWLAGDLCISSKACLQCTYPSMPLP